MDSPLSTLHLHKVVVCMSPGGQWTKLTAVQKAVQQVLTCLHDTALQARVTTKMLQAGTGILTSLPNTRGEGLCPQIRHSIHPADTITVRPREQKLSNSTWLTEHCMCWIPRLASPLPTATSQVPQMGKTIPDMAMNGLTMDHLGHTHRHLRADLQRHFRESRVSLNMQVQRTEPIMTGSRTITAGLKVSNRARSGRGISAIELKPVA